MLTMWPWLRKGTELSAWSSLGVSVGSLMRLAIECAKYKAIPLGGDWKVTLGAIALGVAGASIPCFLAGGGFEISNRRRWAVVSVLAGATLGFLLWDWVHIALVEF